MDQDRFFNVIESIGTLPQVRCFPSQSDTDQDWNLLDFALENPIDCSPLKECIFPGDRIAVVVKADVPSQNTLLKKLTEKLLELGSQANEILVIQDPRQESFQQTASESGMDVFCKSHFRETDDSTEGCSMVGVSKDGEPLYINRHIAEADVVIPVVSFCTDVQGNFGPGYLYPEFSNTQGVDRIGELESEGQAEIRQVESIINPFFVMAVGLEPASGKKSVLFGTRQGIEDQSSVQVVDSWEVEGRQSCKMVVATLQNVERSERFSFAAKAVRNALLVAEDTCPITLVMQNQLTEESADDDYSAEEPSEEDEKQSDRQRFTQLIEQVTEDRPVYLFSPLGQDETEDLGLGFIESEEQLTKMVQRFSPVVCLTEAYRWQVKLADE